MRTRSWIAAVLAATLLAFNTTRVSATTRSLWSLTDLAAQRVEVADKVAAAKYGTPSPIDDPVRDQQILDDVAAKSGPLGLDPAETVAFFRNQIEANKVVQRGLYARWAAHPDEIPAARPDLATEVRPVLDRLNAGLLAEFAATRATRAGRTCGVRLAVTVRLVTWQRRLDALHHKALTNAVPSVCAAS
ncbi:MAG: chorismate mutase [Amycolatopsis sp.]|jgi:chorismate mutase|uniref:chorismate mutase n=1 Tax=Amycolatopsis sp. TaxID=37632 RepID=UPI0026224CD7|nr:chorismate mutase [Amycolatopsis sp.]MCU1686137.1 chorismate mutase [Amycolatopsis sp.]